MEALAQLREQMQELEKLRVRLACIVQGDAQETAEFCGQYTMAAHCIPDPNKETYRKFGLDRATWKSLLLPTPELKQRRKENRAAGFGISVKGSLKSHCDILLLAASRKKSRRFTLSRSHSGAGEENSGEIKSPVKQRKLLT